MSLIADGVCWGVGGQRIIHSISLSVDSGEFVGLLGPNGSGKSSFLRTIYRVYRPDAGIISWDQQNVWNLSARQMAKNTAVLVQESNAQFDFTVREIVMMGRSPHKGVFDSFNSVDYQWVDNALKRVNMLGLSERIFETLSGGEKQRVLIARALAQRVELLILDEPTNHLDIYYQIEILDLIKSLNVTKIAALHDLNLASLYCDRIYLLKDGEIFASGSPDSVLSPELIYEIYGVSSEVYIHPSTGKPHIVFFPKQVGAGAALGS